MTENTTIKISIDTRTELIKVKGRIMTEGRKVTYDDAIQELILSWKKTFKKDYIVLDRKHKLHLSKD